MELKIRLTNSVKDILDRYDVNQLLYTIPQVNYVLNTTAVKVYNNKIMTASKLGDESDPFALTPDSVTITLNKQHSEFITSLAESYDISKALIFNYLIDVVADCGRVSTKDVTHALDCYYYAFEHDKKLFLRILSEYDESVFYDPKRGLQLEDVARFLVASSDGKEIIKTYDNINKNKNK